MLEIAVRLSCQLRVPLSCHPGPVPWPPKQWALLFPRARWELWPDITCGGQWARQAGKEGRGENTSLKSSILPGSKQTRISWELPIWRELFRNNTVTQNQRSCVQCWWHGRRVAFSCCQSARRGIYRGAFMEGAWRRKGSEEISLWPSST